MKSRFIAYKNNLSSFLLVLKIKPVPTLYVDRGPRTCSVNEKNYCSFCVVHKLMEQRLE